MLHALRSRSRPLYRDHEERSVPVLLQPDGQRSLPSPRYRDLYFPDRTAALALSASVGMPGGGPVAVLTDIDARRSFIATLVLLLDAEVPELAQTTATAATVANEGNLILSQQNGCDKEKQVVLGRCRQRKTEERETKVRKTLLYEGMRATPQQQQHLFGMSVHSNPHSQSLASNYLLRDHYPSILQYLLWTLACSDPCPRSSHSPCARQVKPPTLHPWNKDGLPKNNGQGPMSVKDSVVFPTTHPLG